VHSEPVRRPRNESFAGSAAVTLHAQARNLLPLHVRVHFLTTYWHAPARTHIAAPYA
jgi:hypothetical protein